MSTTAPSLDSLDERTSLAGKLLRVARAAYGHSPSAENARKVAAALAEIDRLLDERLVLTR